MKNIKFLTTSAIILTALSSASHAADVDEYKAQVLADVKNIVSNSVIVEKIKTQNTAHTSLSQADIDSLDKKWRAEVKSGSFNTVQTLLDNAASKELNKIKDASQGAYGEIFVMDNKGLNVASSDVTSDYWQGDEAKWKETYLKGANAVHISEVEFDESVQAFTAQISSALSDDTGAVIGAVTFSVVME